MHTVTDADREAAEELRGLLADASGFWHAPGDAGPLCTALARHRERCERELLARMELLAARKASPPMAVALLPAPAPNRELRMRRPASSRSPEIRVESRQDVAGRAR
jgi:hypothetical protein